MWGTRDKPTLLLFRLWPRFLKKKKKKSRNRNIWMQRKTQCHSVLRDMFMGSTVGGRAGRTGGMFLGESLCPATLGMFPGSSEITFFPRMASTPWEILRVIHALRWNVNDFEMVTPFDSLVYLLNTSKRKSLLGWFSGSLTPPGHLPISSWQREQASGLDPAAG